eukprot:Em0024g360a
MATLGVCSDIDPSADPVPHQTMLPTPQPLFAKIEDSTAAALKEKFAGRQKVAQPPTPAKTLEPEALTSSQPSPPQTQSKEEMEQQLLQQADKVRQLKASGAPKDTVDAEVKILKELKAKLGVAEPPKEQKASSGRYGKSLCYAILPWAFDEVRSIDKKSIVIVVSLLVSLTMDQYGQDALMAKIDLKAAFRLIPVQAADWVHLGICWQGQFYVDTCLPFGLRSAPALFNHYAEALDWIMANNNGAQLLHYLDDFLLVGPPGKDTCQEAMSTAPLACPGVVEAAVLMCRGLFPGSFLTVVERSIRRRRKSLPAGTTLAAKESLPMSEGNSLLVALCLDSQDLPSWNGVAMFLDPEWTAADSLQLYTDASGSLGFGAYFNSAWFRGDWQPHQHLPLRSIQWQELFAIVAAASTWGHLWAGLRIHFRCDNLPIVQAWARQSAKHPDLMRLLRTLFLVAAQHSFTIRGPSTNPNPTSPARDLNHHLQLLLNRAMAPSTATTYATGIRSYQGFCHAFKFIPVPVTKETITLFAAHLSRTLKSRTIQVYVAAVSFLHHFMGYKSPASSNPMLRLAIRGVQCLQEEAAYIQELPLHLPIPGGAMWLQSSPIQHTQSTYWCSHSSCQSRPSH